MSTATTSAKSAKSATATASKPATATATLSKAEVASLQLVITSSARAYAVASQAEKLAYGTLPEAAASLITLWGSSAMQFRTAFIAAVDACGDGTAFNSFKTGLKTQLGKKGFLLTCPDYRVMREGGIIALAPKPANTPKPATANAAAATMATPNATTAPPNATTKKTSLSAFCKAVWLECERFNLDPVKVIKILADTMPTATPNAPTATTSRRKPTATTATTATA